MAVLRNISKFVGENRDSAMAFIAFKRNGLYIVQADNDFAFKGHIILIPSEVAGVASGTAPAAPSRESRPLRNIALALLARLPRRHIRSYRVGRRGRRKRRIRNRRRRC